MQSKALLRLLFVGGIMTVALVVWGVTTLRHITETPLSVFHSPEERERFRASLEDLSTRLRTAAPVIAPPSATTAQTELSQETLDAIAADLRAAADASPSTDTPSTAPSP